MNIKITEKKNVEYSPKNAPLGWYRLVKDSVGRSVNDPRIFLKILQYSRNEWLIFEAESNQPLVVEYFNYFAAARVTPIVGQIDLSINTES